MQHHDVFSSERDLLSMLRMEQKVRRLDNPGALVHLYRNASSHSLSNSSIVDRRCSLDSVALTRRLSIGTGLDGFTLSALPTQHDNRGAFDFHNNLEASNNPKHLVESKRKCDRIEDYTYPSVKRKKKRRLSSLGFLSASFFDDHFDPSEHRRDSLVHSSRLQLKEDNAMDISGKGREEYKYEYDNEENEPETDFVQNRNDLEKTAKAGQASGIKYKMEAFSVMMERSQRSQQLIHDWDRKMGLKRSHSKTMRLTMRSRKKLLTTIKNDINEFSFSIYTEWPTKEIASW